jgi:predicted acetyltransferase
MEIQVAPAQRAHQDTLRNLMQLYAYDFSEILFADVQDDGRFEEHALDAYWQDAWRFPFLIHAGERLAGFALIHRKSRLSGADSVWDMAEFFVLRRYRRAGVGTQAAHRLFVSHLGQWEVRERQGNVGATEFWRKAISAYTGGRFTEELYANAVWRGPVQRFTSGGRDD